MDKHNSKHHTLLIIPEGMQTIAAQTMANTKGSKRREGAVAWRLGIGLSLSLYIGPFGYVLAAL